MKVGDLIGKDYDKYEKRRTGYGPPNSLEELLDDITSKEPFTGIDHPPPFTVSAILRLKHSLSIDKKNKYFISVGYENGNQLGITGSKKKGEEWIDCMKREMMEEISCKFTSYENIFIYENYERQKYNSFLVNIDDIHICPQDFAVDDRLDEVSEYSMKSKIVILIYGTKEKLENFMRESIISKENIDKITNIWFTSADTALKLIRFTNYNNMIKKKELLSKNEDGENLL